MKFHTYTQKHNHTRANNNTISFIDNTIQYRLLANKHNAMFIAIKEQKPYVSFIFI